MPILLFCSEIRLIFVGDIMTHNAQLKQAKIGNDYDFSGQFKQISPFLKNSDFVAGNFESTSDKSKNFSSYPAFNLSLIHI